MKRKNSPEPVPAWVPVSGHALRHAGIHFDAVRIPGIVGEEVTYEILSFTLFQAGPIVLELTGARNVYFLLPPMTATAYRWPPGVRALSRGSKGEAFVGVPALDGLTWPLAWRSLPTAGEPFVEPELLFELVTKVTQREARTTGN
jgi:hypothetical protein